MNTLTENELIRINGGMAMDLPPQQPRDESAPINWLELWYWELTH